MAPAPIKPIPDKIPSGSRIKSIVMKDVAGLPAVGSNTLTSIIAIDAARQTSIVVRKLAERPRSLRLMPINAPAKRLNAKRIPISPHPRCNVIAIGGLPSCDVRLRNRV
jgi:hypothetical protein